MGKLVTGFVSAKLDFNAYTFAPIKMKIGGVNEAGTVRLSGPKKGQKREEATCVIKGRPTIGGKKVNYATATIVGNLASMQQDKLGEAFEPKSFEVKPDGSFKGILHDEAVLGMKDGAWFGKKA